MTIIQISEEQAREMLIGHTVSYDIVEEWKEKGYIKKSPLEEARELVAEGDDITFPSYSILNKEKENLFRKAINLYEEYMKDK